MQRIDSRFQLTPEEHQRCEAARTIQDAPTWRATVSSLIELILYSHAQAELTVDEGLDFVWRVSIGCFPQDRIHLLGTFAYLARTQLARNSKRRKPTYPTCLRIGTADLILSIKSASPDVRVTPRRTGNYDDSSPIIRKALEVLKVMNWFGAAPEPAPDTIASWVRERQKESGQTLRRGRPRTKKS
jgi:hypothetical protein